MDFLFKHIQGDPSPAMAVQLNKVQDHLQTNIWPSLGTSGTFQDWCNDNIHEELKCNHGTLVGHMQQVTQ